MKMHRSIGAFAVALFLAIPAMPAQIELPSHTSGTLITLADKSEVHVHSSDSIEVTAHTIRSDRATMRMELSGDVRIKVMHEGSEVVTIATSSAVITGVEPKVAR
jgi:hypothetical protein